MPKINIYELTLNPLEKVLPIILLKALEQGHRAVVLSENEQKTEELNRMLWTFSTNKFIPHGSAKDGFADRQPVYLAHTAENDRNPNLSDSLFVTFLRRPEDIHSYAKCAHFFDGTLPEEAFLARSLIAEYAADGIEVEHWRQKPGGWEKASGVSA